jgi:NTE family protein
VPRLPTFGVRLSAFCEKLNNTVKLTGYFSAMLNTMRHIYDFDFLLKNPDYSQLICRLDTDNDFNWEGYKELRRQLLTKS